MIYTCHSRSNKSDNISPTTVIDINRVETLKLFAGTTADMRRIMTLMHRKPAVTLVFQRPYIEHSGMAYASIVPEDVGECIYGSHRCMRVTIAATKRGAC